MSIEMMIFFMGKFHPSRLSGTVRSSHLSISHRQSSLRREGHADDPQDRAAFASPSRNTSSKYDFVKVKVWLGENADHYYVLSRFLLCRMLTVTKIPNHVAIKIALELKKLLVDNSLLDEGHADDPQDRAAFASPSRNTSSKYDFVKVKVWLGENADHYYVLSRFLLCRMLTVTKIPNHVAIKIALELKKLLVDNSLLDVSQSDLEANLFKLMKKQGYGEDYINRYKMMTRFHHQRVPLVVLVCGTACTGKSIIATQLAGRLNLPNVLQTDMVYELLRTSMDAPLTSVPVWARDFDSPEELITEFCRECRVVRKGLAGDLKKAMTTLPPVHVIGIHLDPSIYLMDEEKREDNSKIEKRVAESENSPASVESKTERQHENELHEKKMDVIKEDPANSQEGMSVEGRISEGLSCAKSHEIISSDSAYSKEKNPRAEGEGQKYLDIQKNNATKKDKPAAEPIVVPIVLRMSDFDHKDHRKLINNLKLIQDYLCFESQGLTIVDISANSFPQTLDWLHGYLLQSISLVKEDDNIMNLVI
ncbi:hypothetical protein E2562_036309 [Oryza meyeriana var. granulata]|uniref:2-phosphoglycerate kinase n=1 Tax=Oryza meyeriana var. granulata TaxID=110450 RepID=A0A6G1FG96_9ORYZ|nr:hypothetical protein E2562_036309 [Oryza meyeriana var. granulata]